MSRITRSSLYTNEYINFDLILFLAWIIGTSPFPSIIILTLYSIGDDGRDAILTILAHVTISQQNSFRTNSPEISQFPQTSD